MYHFVGVNDSFICSLMEALVMLGYKVSASDNIENIKEKSFLIDKGIKLLNEDDVILSKDMIIVCAKKECDNKLVNQADEMNLITYSYQTLIEKLSEKFKTITIAGSHGKTNLSWKLSQVLNNLKGCNYLIDGYVEASTKNEFLVIEAKDQNKDFLYLTSYYSVISNIEHINKEDYKSREELIDAYSDYANNATKIIIANGDNPYPRALDVNKSIFFYGTDEDNDIHARDVKYTKKGTSFDVFVEDNYYGHFDLPIFGKTMLLNTLAIIGICYYERVDAKDLSKILKDIKALPGYFEITKKEKTNIIYDNASHPNELRSIIKAVQQKYEDKEFEAFYIKDECYNEETKEKYDNLVKDMNLKIVNNFKEISYTSNNVVIMSSNIKNKIEG